MFKQLKNFPYELDKKCVSGSTNERELNQSGCCIFITWPSKPIRLRYANFNQYGDTHLLPRCFAVRVVSGSPSSCMCKRTRPAMGRDGASLGKVIGSERLCVMVQVNFNPIVKKIFFKWHVWTFWNAHSYLNTVFYSVLAKKFFLKSFVFQLLHSCYPDTQCLLLFNASDCIIN